LIDAFPPLRWGNGYKGLAVTHFPHPNMMYSSLTVLQCKGEAV